MNIDASKPSENTRNYYVATVLTHDGKTRLAHGTAKSMPEFEQWLATQYDFKSLIWHQSVSSTRLGTDEVEVLEVFPEKSRNEVKALQETRKGAEEATLFAQQALSRLDKSPETLYVAAGPILICQDHILYIQEGAYSHYPNRRLKSANEAFVTNMLGHIVKKFPEKRIIEVSGGGVRIGHHSDGFGYTCRHHLSNFTDVRYFHVGKSSEDTHRIQSHVFLLWQMLQEQSVFAIDLGTPFYPQRYKFSLNTP